MNPAQMSDGQAAGANGKSRGHRDPTRTFIMTGLALGDSITYVFFISTVVVLAAWAVTLFIKSVPLKNREEYMGNGASSDVPDIPSLRDE